MLGLYGDRALTYLRRLIDDADPQVRQDARLALLSFAEATGRPIKLQPFRGIHIECLGRLRVYVGNYELQTQDWIQVEGGHAGWQKVQGTLAYLVHCGRRGTGRDTLGSAVWGSTPSPSGLARTLTALRQLLGKHAGTEFVERALVFENDYCMLDPEYYHTDVRMFEHVFDMAVRQEQEQGLDLAAPLYLQAVQLYSGMYMADVRPGNGWSRQRREYLMNSFVLAAERMAEHHFEHQRYEQCIGVCQATLENDETADEIMVWLLRGYARLGHTAELRQAYRRYLRASAHDSADAAMRQDMVVQEYQRLVGNIGM
jgi:DNA-binding SARP family transcriptional activator